MDETDRLNRVSSLSKGEILQLCQALNLEYQSNWTVVELREVLMEYKRSLKDNDVDSQVSRMSRMKKQELLSHVASIGVLTTGNETAAQLLRKARVRLEELQLSNETDLEKLGKTRVDFGTHRGLLHDEVYSQIPTYAEWARTMFREDPQGTTGGLRRLAIYIAKRDASVSGTAPSFSEIPKPTPKVKAKPKAKSTGASSSVEKNLAEATGTKIPEEEGPPQWDGEESTFHAYCLEVRIWKGRQDDLRSNASWSKVPMDTSYKAVHLLKPEEQEEQRAKK